MKSKDLAIICRKMSILLKSGCEITRTLVILGNQLNKKSKKIIQDIQNNIQQGNSITEAFQNTKVFSDFFINMIHAGEVSGNLDEVMNDLSDYYDKEEQIKGKLINILTYPIILISISMATMLFILIFAIPSFEAIFIGNNIEPPILTKIIIQMSIIVRTKPTLILAIIVINILAIVSIIKAKGNAKKIKDKIKLKLPYISNIILTLATTRLCRTLEILVRSGVNIIEAIDIASKVVNNKFIEEKLDITKDAIKKGNSISYSISKPSIFPKTFVTMVEVGEESGSLDYTLKITNEFYTDELKTSMERIRV